MSSVLAPARVRVAEAVADFESAPFVSVSQSSSAIHAACLAVGVVLGGVFVQSEVASWYRIQEMFRFQSLHLYGVIGVAVAVAFVSMRLLRWAGWAEPASAKAWTGLGTRYWVGGVLFGIGWALVGACPGPLFALLGVNPSVGLVGIAGALLGTWSYAAARPRLPH